MCVYDNILNKLVVKSMKKAPKITIIFIILLISLLGIFVYRWINLPPGCRDTGLVMGGCFSKQKVRNVKIVNPTDCLDIQISNCLNPSIQISNNCNKGYIIEGVEYESQNNYIDLEEGDFFVEGEIDGKSFNISGYVTESLCN